MNNRDMFYQNLNQGYSNPGGFIPPSGYNVNSQYQAYGPNVIPEQMGYTNNDEFEKRINKLERQIKNLDTRLQKLESASLEINDNNLYMI